MPRTLRNHVVISQRTRNLPYASIQQGRNIVIPRQGLDPAEHGPYIRDEFETAIAEVGFADRTFLYITFRSAPEFYLDIEKLDKGDFHLSSYKKIEDDNGIYYEATVCINRNAVSQFLRKIEAYINGRTRKGNPFNQTLIANIESIRAATLQSFWEEPEDNFPDSEEVVWWEVWLHRYPNEEVDNPVSLLGGMITETGITAGARYLSFPEHWVFLLRGTVNQLANALLYTDRLSELRKPVELADFFTYMDVREQGDWINDLVTRVIHDTDSPISVCLLDTGINRAHPLLENIVPERHLDSVNPHWAKGDGHPSGHGTPMAGLSLYGNLTPLLANRDAVRINHHLESIRLVNAHQPHDPEVYGAVTQEAVARAGIINPDNKRLVCMAVTSNEFIHKGRPSAWSSAIDQMLFGSVEEPNINTLFFISSGNLSHEDRLTYPLINRSCSIEDPAQSFNAITVGAYTLLDNIDQTRFPGATPLARRGAMSPCNTTSEEWDSDWCRKPDIVMEGGNNALQHGGLVTPDSMQLLSISKGGFARPPLYSFGDTSGAAALAAKFGAELYYAYPNFWPETIRGLIIHSADWTSEMLGRRDIIDLTEAEKKKLISNVGYGVPNLEKARYSADNSLSLIAERTLHPYRLDGRQVKTRHFHLFDLPWPQAVLEDLFNTEVTLTVTLSYFIEPNPGNKRYELAGSYRSYGLRFKMIDSGESERAFTARISKEMRGADYEREGGEHWILGNKVRDKGSIHKDIWKGNAVDLSTRNKIAVYPVGGWWKTRAALERYSQSVRYSLIITIDSPVEDIDIYTPVFNENQIQIEL